MARMKLGDLLVKDKLIDQETLQKVLELQANSDEKLGRILVNMGDNFRKKTARSISQSTKHPLC